MHFRFIIHEYSYYQICVSVPHFVGIYVYAGTINRPLQLLTDCHFAANGLPKCNEHTVKNTRNSHKIRGEHSANTYETLRQA